MSEIRNSSLGAFPYKRRNSPPTMREETIAGGYKRLSCPVMKKSCFYCTLSCAQEPVVADSTGDLRHKTSDPRTCCLPSWLRRSIYKSDLGRGTTYPRLNGISAELRIWIGSHQATDTNNHSIILVESY